MELFDILVGTVSVDSHVSIASLLIESSFLALTTASRPHISGHFDDTKVCFKRLCERSRIASPRIRFSRGAQYGTSKFPTGST